MANLEAVASEVHALVEATRQAYAPTVVDLDPAGSQLHDTTVLVVPPGMQVVDAKKFIDAARPFPERREGTAHLDDLASFIAHAKRYADGDSVIFADADSPRLLCVFDYNLAGADGAARWGQHRADYTLPVSDEWTAWTEAGEMNQAAFAEFVENRIGDVLDPAGAGDSAAKIAATLGITFASPQRLIELSRGLSMKVDHKIGQSVNLASGEGQIQFTEEHSDQYGAPLKIPGGFLIGVPVFKGGALYQISVRLRYRVTGGRVLWRFDLYRTDLVFEDAFKEAADAAQAATALPVFRGKPEA